MSAGVTEGGGRTVRPFPTVQSLITWTNLLLSASSIVGGYEYPVEAAILSLAYEEILAAACGSLSSGRFLDSGYLENSGTFLMSVTVSEWNVNLTTLNYTGIAPRGGGLCEMVLGSNYLMQGMTFFQRR